MERAYFLDELITKYSYDEVYEVYELCVNYYHTVTGDSLSPSSKDSLQNVIYQRPPLSTIRDTVDTLIDMFNNRDN